MKKYYQASIKHKISIFNKSQRFNTFINKRITKLLGRETTGSPRVGYVAFSFCCKPNSKRAFHKFIVEKAMYIRSISAFDIYWLPSDIAIKNKEELRSIWSCTQAGNNPIIILSKQDILNYGLPVRSTSQIPPRLTEFIKEYITSRKDKYHTINDRHTSRSIRSVFGRTSTISRRARRFVPTDVLSRAHIRSEQGRDQIEFPTYGSLAPDLNYDAAVVTLPSTSAIQYAAVPATLTGYYDRNDGTGSHPYSDITVAPTSGTTSETNASSSNTTAHIEVRLHPSVRQVGSDILNNTSDRIRHIRHYIKWGLAKLYSRINIAIHKILNQ